MDGTDATAGNHGSMTSNKHNMAKNGAVSFFRRQELLLVHNHWQVQQFVVPLSQICWALIFQMFTLAPLYFIYP